MSPADDYIDFYLEKLKARDFDAAFHGLIEADHSVIPKLIEIFRRERSPYIRRELVRIIWEHRQPSTIPFLASALDDSSPDVWQSALDGLVALESPDALPFIQVALNRSFASAEEGCVFRSWVEEAVRQLTVRIDDRAHKC